MCVRVKRKSLAITRGTGSIDGRLVRCMSTAACHEVAEDLSEASPVFLGVVANDGVFGVFRYGCDSYKE